MKRLILFFIAVNLFAGLPVTAVWEVRTAGLDTNGGGFDSSKAGTDYSQNNNANATSCSNCGSSSNNLSTTCTTTTTGGFTTTCAAASFTTAITGNLIYLVGGTGGTVTTGWYEATYASSTTITLDRSPGAAATLVTMNVGGALASPGQACSVAVGSNIIWIGGGTYTLSSGSVNVAGGTCKPAGSGNSNRTRVFGYSTSRWTYATGPTSTDFANRPVFINASFTGISIVDLTNGTVWVENLIVDCNSASTCTSVNSATASTVVDRILARNFTTYGIEVGASAYNSEVTGGTSCTAGFYLTASSNAVIHSSTSHGNGCSGFYTSNGGFIFDSLSYGNNGAGFAGASAEDLLCFGCTSYGNTSHGFSWNTGGYKASCVNCLSYGDGTSSGYGFINSSSTANAVMLINCAAGGEGTGNTSNMPYQENFVSLSANPFVSSGGGNFALNTTAGGGSSLRAAGFPGVMPPGTTTGYADIGAIQHADPAGGAVASGAPIQ